MPTEPFCRYIMTRTINILIRWRQCLFCTRPTDKTAFSLC